MEKNHLNIEKYNFVLLGIMPAHHIMYGNMCHGSNNKLNIHPKGMATFKKDYANLDVMAIFRV